MYKKLAYIDSTTGLGNRAAFEKFISECEETLAPDASVTVISLDLNNLKEINDTYGHDAGDELIRGAAACIMQTFDKPAQCFRIGGDEFAVVNASPRSIDADAERLDRIINEYNMHAVYPVSIALGYSYGSPCAPEGIRGIYKQADNNMYYNKVQLHKLHGSNKYSQ